MNYLFIYLDRLVQIQNYLNAIQFDLHNGFNNGHFLKSIMIEIFELRIFSLAIISILLH